MWPGWRRTRVKARADRNGLHLFDRSSGLNVLIEHGSNGSTAAAPRYLSVALTNACDLACAYCYAPKQPARLTRGTLESWLEELDRNGCLGVGFGGGEPTLYPGFADLCRWTEHHTNLAVTFTTHGHHLDDRLCSQLRGAIHFIRISMDGIGETYERLRRRPFESLVDAIGRVRELAPFGINYVVNEDTLPDLDQAADFAASVGAAELLLLPQESNGRLPEASEATRQGLADWVRGAAIPPRLAISERGAVDGLPLAQPFVDGTPLASHAHIDASGTLKASSYDPLGVPVGASVIAALSRLRLIYPDPS